MTNYVLMVFSFTITTVEKRFRYLDVGGKEGSTGSRERGCVIYDGSFDALLCV